MRLGFEFVLLVVGFCPLHKTTSPGPNSPPPPPPPTHTHTHTDMEDQLRVIRISSLRAFHMSPITGLSRIAGRILSSVHMVSGCSRLRDHSGVEVNEQEWRLRNLLLLLQGVILGLENPKSIIFLILCLFCTCFCVHETH